jgi:hypothetical protein
MPPSTKRGRRNEVTRKEVVSVRRGEMTVKTAECEMLKPLVLGCLTATTLRLFDENKRLKKEIGKLKNAAKEE